MDLVIKIHGAPDLHRGTRSLRLCGQGCYRGRKLRQYYGRQRAGDDIILDGAGKNILMGGSGSDTFVMSTLTEKDTILDFKVGTDHLYFENGLTVTNVAQQNILFTRSTVLTLSGGSTVALVGVSGVGDWHTLM